MSTAQALMDLGFEQVGEHHGGVKLYGTDGWGFVDGPERTIEVLGWTRPNIMPRDDWRFFATVRDPRDAVVSWLFHLQIPEPWTLETFRRELGEKRLSGYLRDGRLFWHLPLVDTVLRYETLEKDLGEYLDGAGATFLGDGDDWLMLVPRPKLPRRHVSEARKGRQWQSFYDDESLEYVTGMLPEIKELGYE